MENDGIIDELNREFSNDPWHGLSLKEILDGITPEQAAARPIAGAHSIFELVLHMTGWKIETRRRLSGVQAADPQQGDWPPVTDSSSEGWRAALRALDTAHQELLQAVRSFPESRLRELINDPRYPSHTVTYYVLLHGIVQHDVYHSGQIALLKKAASSAAAS